jgi:hypothetical protein
VPRSTLLLVMTLVLLPALASAYQGFGSGATGGDGDAGLPCDELSGGSSASRPDAW